MDFLINLLGPWKGLLRAYKFNVHWRWLVLGVVVGAISGLAAAGFFLLIEAGKFLILHVGAHLELPAPAGERLFEGFITVGEVARPWVVPIATTAVGLLTGWLVNRYIPDTVDSGTDGTDAMINAFHNKGGVIRPSVWSIKGFTAVLTLASGGSAGQEGPISQIGAGIGCWLADKLKLTTRERRLLLLAGAAGGLGAIFRAPLGGALTAIEVIYKEDFEAEAILPAVLSSVTAYSLFTVFYGTHPIFGIPKFVFRDPRELLFYTILAVVCAFTGWIYVRSFYFIKYSIFRRIQDRVGLMWATGLGGLVMGIFGMLYPKVLSGGYGWLELAIRGQVPLMIMLTFVVAKTVATSVTIGSGMSGGMFAPALFVGGMAGGVVGQLGNKFFGHIVTQPGAYVLVGMTAFFASVANAPIGPLIMVCEITQGYGLLAPLMLASVICIVLGHSFSLYENQVENKFESPAHVDDATINILENLHVSDFYKPGRVTVLEEATTLHALTDIIANTNEMNFPVRGVAGDLTGVLSVQSVRNIIFEQGLFDLIVARDLASRPVLLHPDDDLYTALLKFVDTGYSQIPVVATTDDRDILGMINRENVFRAYAETIKKVHAER